MFTRKVMVIIICCLCLTIKAQDDDAQKDSLYILEVEAIPGRPKVLHAEPLFIDLIRDLGARKGEREWNVGMGMSSNRRFDSYETLVEYEWAPVDRLGLEIELPFTFFSPVNKDIKDTIPANKLNALKLAAQWSFFVNERIATTLALGYIHEFETPDFNSFGRPFMQGNVFNPFLILAKRWGNNFHTLLYTGPRIERSFSHPGIHRTFQINSNIHYMIPGTRNFVGVEINKTIDEYSSATVLRPQIRVGITDGVLLGIVAGIPFDRQTQGLSTFVRLIWEPGHKHD